MINNIQILKDNIKKTLNMKFFIAPYVNPYFEFA